MKRLMLALCLIVCSKSVLALTQNPKIHPLITKYASEVPTLLKRASKNTDDNVVNSSVMRINRSGELTVYINIDETNADILASIENAGAIIEKSVKNIVKARVKPESLTQIAALNHVISITPPRFAITRSGSEQTEGDAILNSDDVRTGLGVTGSGIRIGVLSNGIGGIANSVASDDIPNGEDTSCVGTGSGVTCGRRGTGAEGTAMMEIIYDMAPDAELYFYGVDDVTDMIDGIDYLTNDAVVDIIVDDLGFPSEPFFTDGDVADEVQASIDDGVIYVTAAGNDAQAHVQETFDDTDVDGEHNFAGSGNNYFIVQVGSSSDIVLQWDDAHYGAPTNDLDLTVQLYSNADDDCFDNDSEFNGGTLLGTATSAEDNINGGSSVEYAFEAVSVDDGCAVIFITRSVSDGSPLNFELIPFGIVPGSGGDDIEYTVEADSIYGHPAIDETIAVGAISQDDPLNDDIAAYSSHGPSTVSGVERNKPDVVGIDAVSVTGNGGFGTPFSGTSAAAPGIAACAALMLEANDQLSHTQVKSILQDTAEDRGAVGYDFVFGSGLVDCFDATSTAEATTGEGRTREANSGGGGSSAGCSLEVNSSYHTNWTYLLLGLTCLLLVTKKRYQKE